MALPQRVLYGSNIHKHHAPGPVQVWCNSCRCCIKLCVSKGPVQDAGRWDIPFHGSVWGLEPSPKCTEGMGAHALRWTVVSSPRVSMPFILQHRHGVMPPLTYTCLLASKSHPKRCSLACRIVPAPSFSAVVKCLFHARRPLEGDQGLKELGGREASPPPFLAWFRCFSSSLKKKKENPQIFTLGIYFMRFFSEREHSNFQNNWKNTVQPDKMIQNAL